MFNHTIDAELGEDPVDTGVDNYIIANLKIITGLAHDAIAFVAGNFKVGDQDIIA